MNMVCILLFLALYWLMIFMEHSKKKKNPSMDLWVDIEIGYLCHFIQFLTYWIWIGQLVLKLPMTYSLEEYHMWELSVWFQFQQLDKLMMLPVRLVVLKKYSRFWLLPEEWASVICPIVCIRSTQIRTTLGGILFLLFL